MSKLNQALRSIELARTSPHPWMDAQIAAAIFPGITAQSDSAGKPDLDVLERDILRAASGTETVIVSEGDALMIWLQSQGITGTVVAPMTARTDLSHVAGRRVVGLDHDVTFAMASVAAEVVIVDLGEFSVRYNTLHGREELNWVTWGFDADAVAAVASLAHYKVRRLSS